MKRRYVAVDLGAESGRVIVGTLNNEGIGIEVINRFPSRNTRILGTLYWDAPFIFAKIKEGLFEAVQKYGEEIVSIGVDTWGVDYGLLDSKGMLMGTPVHYRDDRTDGMMDDVFSQVSKETVYQETGIQFMQINTIYQLAAEKRSNLERLQAADRLLFTPDLLNYWLSGVKANEYSIASTSQLFNPTSKQWSRSILKGLGINESLLGEVVYPGTVLGPLHPKLAEELGISHRIDVVATACHDTAAAVAAVPARPGETSAYLSSGTWSLLGIETEKPIINDRSMEANITNEGAADGGIRFLKNIMGLWILQECRRAWEAEGRSIDYGRLAAEAEKVEKSFILDVDDPRFLKPGRGADTMPARIDAWCKEENLSTPRTDAEYARGIIEGLAGAYARTLKAIGTVAEKEFQALHIIGGGCQNKLLNQLTADAVGIPVTAGPVEATAMGNLIYQVVGLGDLEDQAEGRARIVAGGDVSRFEPRDVG